jgi:hypothetical protein
MDDVKHQDLDDLFSSAEGTSTGEDDVKHQRTDTPELGDEQSKDKARLEAEAKMVNDLANKISKGESSLEELSEKQSWLVDKVKAKLGEGKKQSFEADDIERIATAAAKRMFEEESLRQKALSEQTELNKRIAEVKEVITSEQLLELKGVVAEWKAKGLSDLDALNVATLRLGIESPSALDARRNSYPNIVQAGTPPAYESDKIDAGKIGLNKINAPMSPKELAALKAKLK